ncbi:7002_t:CDS:2 [Scutellospora calospora]|uniref:7002_t:CDS:1 n=1 Tax=Scutellospora calospora TaxID=85575 RepID=A0ACA9KHZ4_9GLOM|nr:7002_t:CDS:2 [Scutellospora calospora]
MAKYEKEIPEFRRIPENEKSQIIKRFKRKNPKFPPTSCDWAIKRMMCGIINNKRNTEKRKKGVRLSFDDKKRRMEFLSSLRQNAIERDQPLEVVETSSSANNTKNARLTSSFCVLLTVLRCQNTNHEIQDKDPNDAIESAGKSNKMSQNSGCQLRDHTSRTPARTEESNKTTKTRCMEDDTEPTKERSLKMSSKAKTNSMI